MPKVEQLDPDAVKQKICGARVLLVDDDMINQQVKRGILEYIGLVVKVASNGLDAVQMIAASPFDIVLMDINMPGIDGYETTRRIRNLPQSATMPILALSATLTQGDRQKCMLAGMNDCLIKPVNIQRFYAALIKWLEPADVASTASQPDLVEERWPNVGCNAVVDQDHINENSSTPVHAKQADIFVNLPGIDMGSVLERLNGKHDVLHSLLFAFNRHYANSVTTLRANIQRGRPNDLTTAWQMVHKVKGIAANLAAMKVHEAAHQLEISIKQGKADDYATLIDSYENALCEVLNTAALLMEQTADETLPTKHNSHVPVESLKINSRLRELSDLIQTNDIKAIAQLNSIASLLEDTIVARKINHLQIHLAQFDFDGARKILPTIIALLDIHILEQNDGK